jgi:hypothetical protein
MRTKGTIAALLALLAAAAAVRGQTIWTGCIARGIVVAFPEEADRTWNDWRATWVYRWDWSMAYACTAGQFAMCLACADVAIASWDYGAHSWVHVDATENTSSASCEESARIRYVTTFPAAGRVQPLERYKLTVLRAGRDPAIGPDCGRQRFKLAGQFVFMTPLN